MKTILFLFLLLTGSILSGQQQNKYFIAKESWQFFNPAVLPERIYENNNVWSGNLVVNRTFAKLPGYPVHFGAVFNSHLGKSGFYLGVKATNDRIQDFNESNFSLHLVQRLTGAQKDEVVFNKVKQSHLFTLAISGGIRSVKMGGDELYYHDAGDPLQFGTFSSLTPDFAVGVFYYKYSDVKLPFFVGLSAQHVQGKWFSNGKEDVFPVPVRHLYLHGGGVIFSKKIINMEPMIWIGKVLKQKTLNGTKSVNAPASLDGLVRISFPPKASLWVDLGYSSACSLRAGIGFKHDWFSVSFAFDSAQRDYLDPSLETNFGFGGGKN